MKILITGGFGFIGYHLASRLINNGDSVVLMGHRSPAYESEFNFLKARSHGRVEFVEGSIEEEIHEYLNEHSDVELVYHLAARKATTATVDRVPGSLMALNFDTDIEVFAACECVAAHRPIKLVFMSSGEVYGGAFQQDKALDELTPSFIVPWDRKYLYPASKLAGEMMLKHGGWHFPFVIVRLQNPYGPMMGDQTLIGKLCILATKAAMNSERIEFPLSAANDTRPFIYAPDAAEALEALGKRSSHSACYNLAGTQDIGTYEIAEQIARHAAPGEIIVLPDPSKATHRRMDCSQLEHFLNGWKPRTSLEDGIRDTFRWYAMREGIKKSLGSIGV